MIQERDSLYQVSIQVEELRQQPTATWAERKLSVQVDKSIDHHHHHHTTFVVRLLQTNVRT